MAPVSLVTGAAGFVGTNMVRTLLDAGHTVVATDHPQVCALADNDRRRGRFPAILRQWNVVPQPADLTRPAEILPLVQNVDYVFHIAGIFSYSAPLATLRQVNVEGTRHLCDALCARAPQAHMVVWGAGGVYAPPPLGQLLSRPYTEDSPIGPPNRYLQSKWEQEQLALAYHRTRGLDVRSIRPFTVYGPYGVYGGGAAILQFARPRYPVIPRNFLGRVPFSHVADVCGAALHLAQRPDTAGQAYNVVDNSACSMVDMCRIIAAIRGTRPIVLPPVPLRFAKGAMYGLAGIAWALARLTHRPPFLEHDMVKLFGSDQWHANAKLTATGYVLKYPDARTGLTETIRWYERHGWL